MRRLLSFSAVLCLFAVSASAQLGTLGRTASVPTSAQLLIYEAYQTMVGNPDAGVEGDLNKAEQLCKEAIQTPGEHVLTGVNLLYDIWERRGKPAEGMRNFREYYAKTGDLEFLALGSLRLAESGKIDQAKREIDPVLARILKGEKLEPKIFSYIAYIERRFGDLNAALDAARQAEKGLKAEREDQWIAMGDLVASLLEDLGRTPEALAEYEYLSREAPTSSMILNNYAYYLAVHGLEMEKALSLVERSLVLRPNDGNTLDTYGFVLLKMNKTEDSINAMVKAYRRLPGETMIRTHLAQALAKRKSKSQTMQDLLDVLRTEPDEKNTAEIDRLLLAIGE